MSVIHISVLSGKLKGFQSINTNTVTNSFCQKMQKTDAVCRACYSQAMLTGSRKNCQDSFQRNSDVLSHSRIPLHLLPRINQAWFRFHAHGELINMVHFVNLVNVADVNPQTMFALWTKRKDIIGEYIDLGFKIPENLILIYSNPSTKKVITKIPKNFNKVFNVSEIDHEGENCTGQKCIDCLACYKFSGMNVLIEKMKKRS